MERRRHEGKLAGRHRWIWATALGGLLVVSPQLASRPAPRRIVSLVPAVTEMLFAIGAGEAVVGVSRFDRYPPAVATRTRVGGLLDPDVERLLALRPDLVVLYQTQTDLRDRLRRAGIAAVEYRHGSLGDVVRTIRDLGGVTGHSREAAAVARRIEAELAQVRAAVQGRPRPRTLLLVGREPGTLRGLYASGGLGFLHDLVELAGGHNVFAHIRREAVPVSTEAVLAAAPDVIVEIRAETTPAGTPPDQDLRPWHTLSAVPAVRAGRVHLLVGDALVIPGPRVGQAARRLAQTLHPEVRP